MFVGHDLENQTTERHACISRALFSLTVFRIDSLDRRNVERRRQIVDHCIQQRLHSLVLECRTSDDGHESQRESSLAKRGADLVFGNLFALDIFGHQIVVDGSYRFDQFLSRGRGFFFQLLWNLASLIFRALALVIPDQTLHRNEIDDALELIFVTNWNLNGDGICAEPRNNRIE